MKAFTLRALIATGLATVVFASLVLTADQSFTLVIRLLQFAFWFCVLSLLPLVALSHLVDKFEKRKLRLSELLLWGMMELAILVFLFVAFVLTLGHLPSKLNFLVGTTPAAGEFLSFLATVFTLWAAASSAFILFAQVHNEKLETLRRVDNQEEVLEEVRLWTENPNVARVAFFGAFSAIPGFWEEPVSKAYTQILQHISRGNEPPFSLIGPDESSIRELATFLERSDHTNRLREMTKWSDPARKLVTPDPGDTDAESPVDRIVAQYRKLCDSLGATVKLAPKPWATSAITFAVAHDKYLNPIAAIFFGSPIPSDGLSPGEEINIFRKPLVYMSRREEIGSLLVNLEYVIAEKLGKE
jgi:hypothetical protein